VLPRLRVIPLNDVLSMGRTSFCDLASLQVILGWLYLISEARARQPSRRPGRCQLGNSTKRRGRASLLVVFSSEIWMVTAQAAQWPWLEEPVRAALHGGGYLRFIRGAYPATGQSLRYSRSQLLRIRPAPLHPVGAECVIQMRSSAHVPAARPVYRGDRVIRRGRDPTTGRQ
jgi:hypothetical protein